jgi:anti-sigma-K factor RskA
MNFLDPDEMTALAGEYVLGTLLPEDRNAFDQELMHNRQLAAAVAFWQDRLLEVTPSPAPVEPYADLWKRIERDLPGKPVRQKSGLWSSLVFWRISGMAGVAVAGLLAWLLLVALPQPEKPHYLAVLQAPDNGVSWLVEVDASKLRLRPLSAFNVGSGKAVQFWTKPAGAAGPTSLGLVPTDRPTEILLGSLPGLGPDQLFEVTLEPQTGSPLGRPTGPILAVGKVVRL